MNPPNNSGPGTPNDDVSTVINSLEPAQLVANKRQHHLPRRRFTRSQVALLWALRIYLVFMVGVVIYQIWHTTR